MKFLLRLEEAFMLGLTIYLNSFLSFPAWLFWVLFLTPDIGMAGYLINTRVGAFTYNLLHHKGIAIALYIAGLYFINEALQFAGLLLFGHSAFDRLLGYGLKYNDSFHNTHMGWIGKTVETKSKI
jgi:hypothetical protein